VENLNVNRAHEYYRRQTDGWAIAYSERSLKMVKVTTLTETEKTQLK